MKTNILTLSTSLLILLTAAASHATVSYKCTTDDGKTLYMDTRPATGCATIEEIRLTGGKAGLVDDTQAGGANNAASSPTKQAQDAEHEKKVKELQAQTKEECGKAKTNLEALTAHPHVLVDDGKGGKKALTAEEHQSEMEKAQQFINKFCN